ncbi:hypothetical protein NLG97_g8386 [Lecanicillium saksenae]|uniref:Uncharacterized protein n=1 Tax=Lecanicillium saksenae TaxID=468837 RepID=A0ACC1QJ16_9HYPO|nr:hypothetical protein NLG97_g8386 [Lecanicillium saksenae]
MNYDNRVDSGIGLEGLGDKMPPGLSLREGKKLRVEESQISRGLGLILDYLNTGNGEYSLYELKRRAGNWCQAYFCTRDFACGLPERVLQRAPAPL